MLSNVATEYKLNSPEDWDNWENELLNQARANDLLPILQGTEKPIKKPVQPKEHVRTLLNRPSTMNEDTVDGCAEQRARNDFNLCLNNYKMEFSECEVQHRDIDKIFEWMKQTVCHSYLKTCVYVTRSWKEAYNNLKAQVGQGSREIQQHIQDDYNQHMKPFRGTPRDPETWIVKWEEIMLQGSKKFMFFTQDTEDWASQFLRTIRPLDEVWVMSFEHSINPKIDDGSLTYKDLSNSFRRPIPQLYIKQ
ncbi:conserved hypothetical protein [Talaromyces stipitatus ATCC 10500]|uniref:Uncharacterized protein n=1 Tax=Talaromyces stipitatus (strain ATCC 10500 / CBS 375.48 / QM 6759 / NRRL 1006) TaxID=441959 RepID=B8MPU1_TALSN|nr:uncharacterized protein TSTA_052700 [Talaromyces stipitatus ATCC 10500]EED12749.1 conserved hypothetical protein [Talaromyces stipitatus ATCC 10500]